MHATFTLKRHRVSYLTVGIVSLLVLGHTLVLLKVQMENINFVNFCSPCFFNFLKQKE